MARKLKIVLVGLNSFLVFAGLWFGLPSVRTHIPEEKRNAEQVAAIVERTTDVEKLRAIVKADEADIRSEEVLASLFRQAIITGSAIAIIIGSANVVFICIYVRKDDPSA
jgi:hypothetical protein